MVLPSRPRIVDSVESEEATMTIDAIGTTTPPSLMPGCRPSLMRTRPIPKRRTGSFVQARLQGPIALGPARARSVELRAGADCFARSPVLHAEGHRACGARHHRRPVWDKATTGLLSRDGADHNRLRRLVSKAFTPRSTARLKTTIVEVINELVDPVTSTGRCDVVADIARQYPIAIISGLLGAPREDWQLFSDWADDIFKLLTWNVANDAPVIMAAFDELDAYIDDMVARRRRNLTDDLISELIRAEDDGDRLTADELLMLAEALLMAGTDTTRNQLAAAVQDLCDHPEQWALLAEHPELAPRAVEELMRHNPVIFGTIRTGRRGCRTRRRDGARRHASDGQYRRRQPRPRRLRRS